MTPFKPIPCGNTLLQVVRPESTRVSGTLNAGSHRENHVLALFAVESSNAEKQFVLLQPELSALTYGQEHFVLRDLRADPVEDAISLKHILGAAG
jgi:hypothetical protein